LFTTVQTPIKILLLDANETYLDFLVRCLAEKNRILLTATTGEEAIQYIHHHHDISLLIVATRMPCLQQHHTIGAELRTFVKQGEIPLIFITEHSDINEENILEGYMMGAVDYLKKPVDINILLNKVDIFSRLYQQQHLIKRTNQQLQQHISIQDKITIELERYKNHLEEEVEKRVVELKTTNKRLQEEIQDHLKTEEALTNAEQKYRSIFENTIEGIFQTTPDGHYIAVNPALAEIYGYDSPDEMITQLHNISQQLYVHAPRRKQFMHELDNKDRVIAFESEIYRKNGDIIWISENARAVRDEQGTLLYFEGTVENITERKQAELELQRTNRAYQRFFPEEFLDLLNKQNINDVSLNQCVQREMTTLFSDIRNFTRLSEQLTPRENFEFINSYFSLMGPVVREYRGFIDKYIGDSIMALFDHSPDDAIYAAIEMLRVLDEYNSYRLRQNQPIIKIGLGINTGNMMLGTVGEYHRMEGTVISDAVNLASRIESLTKLYCTPLLISEYTFQRIEKPDIFSFRFIGRVQVKGKEKAVGIYEIFNTDSPKQKSLKLNTKDMFEAGCHLFHEKNYTHAEAQFMYCLQQNPDDTVAQAYVRFCQNGGETMHTVNTGNKMQ